MIALLRAICVFAVRVFYRNLTLNSHQPQGEIPIEASKPGPCIVVANHPNGLLDPVVARIALNRPLGFLAKSTLFGNPVGRAMMRAFDVIPVYRARDNADTTQNERTFQICRDRLATGQWIMLFPEGTSHSDPTMRPLKTGAARIALSAEAANGFRLGLHIVPVGLTYEDKAIFRTRVAVASGKWIGVEKYAHRYAEDERSCVEELTAEINARLAEIVLQAENQELWSGFLAVAAWTQPAGSKALPEERARTLAHAYERIAAAEPDRAARIVDRTRRFSQMLKAVGVEHPFALDSAAAPKAGTIAAYWAPVILLWPIAMLGTLFGVLPYQGIRLLVHLMKVEDDIISTVKAIAGVVFFPLTFIAEALFAGLHWGWVWGVAVLLLAPATSFVAMRYWERVALRREALRAWWLRLSRQSLVEAINQRRIELCEIVEAELGPR